MIYKLKLLIYYTIIIRLPHSRFLKLSNRIRLWYISSILKIMKSSKDSYFENGVYISDAKNVKIGEYCHINERVFIQGARIGNYVMIAPNVSILSSTHKFSSTDIPMIMQGSEKNIIPIIEDDVWIGRNVVILPGVCIKKGSIIAASAVITKDTVPYGVYGGVPAKLIKLRE